MFSTAKSPNRAFFASDTMAGMKSDSPPVTAADEHIANYFRGFSRIQISGIMLSRRTMRGTDSNDSCETSGD